MLDSHDLITVVQAAPSVRVTISEAFGLPPGAVSTGQLVTALKAVGFDYVFDTNVRVLWQPQWRIMRAAVSTSPLVDYFCSLLPQFTADLTIMEEGTELLQRLKDGDRLPLFTSCCPGWVSMVEKVGVG
jgi:NADH-quinone oxidoreductase subunit G